MPPSLLATIPIVPVSLLLPVANDGDVKFRHGRPFPILVFSTQNPFWANMMINKLWQSCSHVDSIYIEAKDHGKEIPLPISLKRECVTETGHCSSRPMSCRSAAIILDMSRHWPGLAPNGYLGNLIMPVPVSVVSDGHASLENDSICSLQYGLAQAVRAIRLAIEQARQQTSLEAMLTHQFEAWLPSAVYLGFIRDAAANGCDALLTNWNQAGHEQMDFGCGAPSSLNGHFGIQTNWLLQ